MRYVLSSQPFFECMVTTSWVCSPVLSAAMAFRRALELFRVTDSEIFGHVEESRAKEVEAASANPEGYIAECRSNIEWLGIHNVVPEGGWDIFTAASKWQACCPNLPPPELILLHGLHYNCVSEIARKRAGTWNNEEFKSIAWEAISWGSALLAHLPESALQSHRPTVAAPSRWEVWDRQLRHVQEVPWKHAGMQARRPPGTAKEFAICDTFDVTQCIAEHLLKGKPVLQLAANRCQATRRCVVELAANATMPSAMPQKSSCPVVWPAPKRRFLEYKENKMYIFSYQGLLAIEKSWKVDVLDLAAYRACGEPCDEDQVEGEQQLPMIG